MRDARWTARRLVAPWLALLWLPTLGSGQDAPAPEGLAELELARSRQCVSVIAQLDALEAALQPLTARSERLMEIARAIAIEDPTIVGSLDRSDPIESQVADWFDADEALAQRLVAQQDSALVAERTALRDAIKDSVSASFGETQLRSQELVEETGDLPRQASECDGAIFIRSAVLEECRATPSPVCEAAGQPAGTGRFRFVDDPEGLWDIEQHRPWVNPGGLFISPGGQLEGARTGSIARTGNLVLTLTFAPFIQRREDLPAEQVIQLEAAADSLGLHFDHPDLIVAPALAISTSNPEPLAGETLYVLHFDDPEQADVIWTGRAGGGPVDAMTALPPRQVVRLGGGEVVRFTAVREVEGEEARTVYSVPFTTLNQTPATTALLGYMAGQLGADLTQILSENP